MNTKNNMITIDGPAGSGKSTIAHALAQKLHWVHVNTGAIYRTFAFIVNRMVPVKPWDDNTKVSMSSHGLTAGTTLTPEIIEKAAAEISADYLQDDTTHQIYLNKKNISAHIHTSLISNLSSVYAQDPLVREKLLPIQRKIIAQYPGVIVDGRDMGTIVFPNAPLKIFLTANPETRAQRRATELQERGLHVNFETILSELKERDLRDSTRNIAPTKPASDAIIIDSSEYTVEEVVDKIFLLFSGLQESKYDVV